MQRVVKFILAFYFSVAPKGLCQSQWVCIQPCKSPQLGQARRSVLEEGHACLQISNKRVGETGKAFEY